MHGVLALCLIVFLITTTTTVITTATNKNNDGNSNINTALLCYYLLCLLCHHVKGFQLCSHHARVSACRPWHRERQRLRLQKAWLCLPQTRRQPCPGEAGTLEPVHVSFDVPLALQQQHRATKHMINKQLTKIKEQQQRSTTTNSQTTSDGFDVQTKNLSLREI